MSGYTFDQAPARVYWELTRACDLACRHCRAEAQHERGADELTTEECERVLDSLAMAPPSSATASPSSATASPHVIFTGGDPLKRPDLLDLIRGAVGRGLDVSVAPSATMALTRDTVLDLKAAGVSAMSLSIDGPDAARHDGLRGVFGCFGWTLVAAKRIVSAGIPLQINTLVSQETMPHLDAIGTLVAKLGAARWSLFFLVQVGRGRALGQLTPRDCELTLAWVARNAKRWPFTMTTTEAPHYRRVVVQQMRAAGRPAADIQASPVARGFGIRDGNGIMFIAANGDVTPSGFLPLVVGNVRTDDVLDLYRNSALFQQLRMPHEFEGRCGACTFGTICGGSRARAWAATGNPFQEDGLCTWEPPVAERSGALATVGA